MKQVAQKLLKRAVKIQTQLEAVKPLYVEMDRITEELVNLNITEGMVGRYRLYISDNFREKNTSWKSSAFRRYQVNVERKATKLEPFPVRRRV